VFRAIRLISAIWLIGLQMSFAGSATWDSNPTNNNWGISANWTPETIPDAASDVATFDASNVTDIEVEDDFALDSMVFQPGADAYSFAITETPFGILAFYGIGVVNNSGRIQNFDGFGYLSFFNSATAGMNVVYKNEDTGNAFSTTIGFIDQSTAGSATFINVGSSGPGLYAGAIDFNESSSADHSTIINESGSPFSGGVGFRNTSTAGNSTITTYSGGNVVFFDNATGANANLIEDGGRLRFEYQSTGGLARVQLLHSGWLDLTSRNKSGPMSIGSLEGDSSGLVMLGSVKVQQLAIGGNGLNTTFPGSINGGTTGSILKTGPESLTLSGANTYAGGTTITDGSLIVANSVGSATGTGAVTIKAGTLGGSGTIAGPVTVGTGSGSGAFLAPAAGSKKLATLTIQSALTCNSDATYTCTFQAKANKARIDQVIANGVTINGAAFNLTGQAEGRLRRGLALTLISNTSVSPINGTFNNLPDGAIVTVNRNNLQASYEGGDGNDLTLTVQ
jgi:autotransporter-associated beta strand protein